MTLRSCVHIEDLANRDRSMPSGIGVPTKQMLLAAAEMGPLVELRRRRPSQRLGDPIPRLGTVCFGPMGQRDGAP